jgi:hypothetical protein
LVDKPLYSTIVRVLASAKCKTVDISKESAVLGIWFRARHLTR